MATIQQMILEYIQDTGEAHEETREGELGVVFHDEGEFIPYADLGYNSVYGFYRLSNLPDVANEAT